MVRLLAKRQIIPSNAIAVGLNAAMFAFGLGLLVSTFFSPSMKMALPASSTQYTSSDIVPAATPLFFIGSSIAALAVLPTLYDRALIAIALERRKSWAEVERRTRIFLSFGFGCILSLNLTILTSYLLALFNPTGGGVMLDSNAFNEAFIELVFFVACIPFVVYFLVNALKSHIFIRRLI